MSYAVVNMQKCKAGGIRGIQSHNKREHESRTNADIDYTKSVENYELHESGTADYNKKVNEIIQEFRTENQKAVRKDAVVMCNFIVTSDHDFFKEMPGQDQEQFFKDSYEWLANRYGKENVVHATVHLDEHTPHMHMGIVPITDDGRLSCKAIFDRKELTDLQTEFVQDVGANYGLERGLEGSDRTRLSEQQFKMKMAEERAAAAVEQEQKAIATTNEVAARGRQMQKDIQALEKEENALQGKIDGLQAAYDGKILTTKGIKAIEKNAGRSLMGKVQLEPEQFENLTKTAKQYTDQSEKIASLSKNLKSTKQNLAAAEDKLETANQALTEREGLKLDKIKRQAELERKSRAFDKLPESVQKDLLQQRTQQQDRGLER